MLEDLEREIQLLKYHPSPCDRKRNIFFEKTKSTFFGFTESFSDERILEKINSLEIIFNKGWSNRHSLKEALNSSRDVDQRKTTTTLGPHKADIKFLIKDIQ